MKKRELYIIDSPLEMPYVTFTNTFFPQWSRRCMSVEEQNEHNHRNPPNSGCESEHSCLVQGLNI